MDGKAYWNGQKGGWLEVGETVINVVSGKLLRRGLINESATCIKDVKQNRRHVGPGKLCIIVTLIPGNLDKRNIKNRNHNMLFRWISFSCNGSYPLRVHGESSEPFNI